MRRRYLSVFARNGSKTVFIPLIPVSPLAEVLISPPLELIRIKSKPDLGCLAYIQLPET